MNSTPGYGKLKTSTISGRQSMSSALPSATARSLRDTLGSCSKPSRIDAARSLIRTSLGKYYSSKRWRRPLPKGVNLGFFQAMWSDPQSEKHPWSAMVPYRDKRLCSGATFPALFWNCHGGCARMVRNLREPTSRRRSRPASGKSGLIGRVRLPMAVSNLRLLPGE